MPQGWQFVAPVVVERLYVPGAHDVHDVAPAEEYVPPEHASVQLEDVRPVVAPYLPAAHCPLHAAVVRPAVDPNVPAGHAMHSIAPAGEYVPIGQIVSVVPSHLYPARHNLLPEPDPLVEVLPN